ncbi:MAG: arsenic efflux protein [Clostridia bacterium]|nr:arsenic efflux protein [Clostridia bacterium]
MGHVILHTLLDSLKLLPFLLISYILIELVESWTSKNGSKDLRARGTQVLIGASLGLIPQCGFSVVATDLYTKRKLSMGALVAIYIATSDEAFPLLIASPEKAHMLVPLLVLKFIFALGVGYLVFGVESKLKQKQLTKIDNHSHEHEDHKHNENHEHNHGHEDHNHEEHTNCDHDEEQIIHIGCCGHTVEETDAEISTTKKRLKRYLLHPLKHTLYIFVFIFAVNLVFGTIVHFVGEESLALFLAQAKPFTPLLAVLVGFIPNCASSVVLTNMYILGSLPFGALLSGLIANAGIAVTVLFKQNKPLKNTLAILGIVTLTALAAGYATLYLF